MQSSEQPSTAESWEQRQAREAAERLEQRTKFRELAGSIARKLEQGPWTLKPLEDGDRLEHYSCAEPQLEREDGAALYISTGREHGRIRIGGRMWVKGGDHTNLHPYLDYNTPLAPDITVSSSKSVEQIARDIERRLLPLYLEQFAKGVAGLERHRSTLERVKTAAEAFASKTGATIRMHHSRGNANPITLSLACGAELELYASHDGTAIRYTVKDARVSAELALKIARELAAQESGE